MLQRFSLEAAAPIPNDSVAIFGVMLESYLVQGSQAIVNGWENLRYGQSVTDGCIGWDDTVAVLDRLAAAVRLRRTWPQ